MRAKLILYWNIHNRENPSFLLLVAGAINIKRKIPPAKVANGIYEVDKNRNPPPMLDAMPLRAIDAKSS